MLAPHHEHLLERLDAIPGAGRDAAQVILAELGTDMSHFLTAAHAASWAGLAPRKTRVLAVTNPLILLLASVSSRLPWFKPVPATVVIQGRMARQAAHW